MNELAMWSTAFVMGLLGGAHCIGMCGGIIGALTMASNHHSSRKRWLLIGLYNTGRILSYVVIALVFYLLVDALESYFSWRFMRVVAGFLLIAMGLYLADWWRGLVYLEKLGGIFWRFLQPLSRRLIPVKYYRQAFVLGALWGWLPCGLIYSALVYSATASSAFSAGITMFAFALGTLPAVLITGLFAEKIMSYIKHRISRTIMAILMMVFGLWVLYGELSAHQHIVTHDNVHTESPHHH